MQLYVYVHVYVGTCRSLSLSPSLSYYILFSKVQYIGIRSVYRSGNRDVIERLQIRKSHTRGDIRMCIMMR